MSEQISTPAETTSLSSGPERDEAQVTAQGEAAAAEVRQLEAAHAAIEDPERRCADIKV